MNSENMLKLANVIEKLPDQRFNMSFWFSEAIVLFKNDKVIVTHRPIDFVKLDEPTIKTDDCGTAGCIAGWAATLAMNDGMKVPGFIGNESNTITATAQAIPMGKQYLGLNEDEANQLFYWDNCSIWKKYHEELGLELLDDNDNDDWNEIDPKSITTDVVAFTMRSLVNGTFKFNNDDVDHSDY